MQSGVRKNSLSSPTRIVARCLMPAAVLLSGTLAVSCGKSESEDKGDKDDEVIMEYGDSVLTVTEVTAKIPAGLAEGDSTRMFDAITGEWLAEMLLADIAEENLGKDADIERNVQDYRRKLIVSEYRRRISRQNSKASTDKSVADYYARNAEEFVLDRPLVKGIYLKLPSNDKDLENARRWMRQSTRQSIAKIEKNILPGALQYDNFTDTWQDWENIRSSIPYHFPEADAFVRANRYFETTHGGSVYMLRISEYLPTGAKTPYEIAASAIKMRLDQTSRADAEERLINSLKEKAIQEGKLKINRK